MNSMNLPFKIRPDIQAYAKLASRPGNLVAGQVELTSKCFQKCAMCESWRDDLSGVQRGTWTLEQLKRLCLELGEYPTFEHLAFTGGDPQYWPHLGSFLEWFRANRRSMKFSIQLNTALTQDLNPSEAELWRDVVRDVRVSLDAATERTYQLMRGDKRDPVEIVCRMANLDHPRMATNTCVTTKNIGEVESILELLSAWSARTGFPRHHPFVRKAMFLAVIGDRDQLKAGDEKRFWESYELLKCLPKHYPLVPTSFQEDVAGVREFLASEEAKDLKCYAGYSTFHVKANGDWYPCCLTGGEAIATYSEFRMGNFFEDSLAEILGKFKAEGHYGCADKPCAKICQYKQLSLNLAAAGADGEILAMP